MRIDRTPLRALVSLAAAVALAAGAAACTDQSPDLPERISPAPALPTGAPQPDLTAEEQQAVEDVQVLIEEFLAAYLDLLVESPPVTDDQLGRVPHLGFGLLADQVWAEVSGNHDHERRADGQVEWVPHEVVEVDLERIFSRGELEVHQPWIRLRYCADATGYQVVDKATGQPTDPAEDAVMPRPGDRHQVLLVSIMYTDQALDEEGNPRWWVEEWVNEEDRPC